MLFRIFALMPMISVFFSFQVLANSKHLNKLALGKVLFTKGDVMIMQKNTRKKLKKGDLVYFGEYIQTGDKSLAVVAFGNAFHSKMKVIQNSNIQITQEKFSVKTRKRKKTNIILSSGGVMIKFINKNLNKWKQRDVDLNLRMKNASLGVRGTTFFAYENGCDRFMMWLVLAFQSKSAIVSKTNKRRSNNVIITNKFG